MKAFGKTRHGAVLALLVCVTSGAAAQAASRQPGGVVNRPVAYAVRVDRAPRLDGTLDDPLWQRWELLTLLLIQNLSLCVFGLFVLFF